MRENRALSAYLTSDPDAEAEKVEVPLALHGVPAEVRVPFGHQFTVGLEAAPGQVHGYLLQVVLPVASIRIFFFTWFLLDHV